METVTNDAVLHKTTVARRGDSSATEPLRILFTTKEVLELSGLSRNTLKFWRVRQWVTPVGRAPTGYGHEHLYSAWQTIGLVLPGTALKTVRDHKSYIGRNGVVRAREGDTERIVLEVRPGVTAELDYIALVREMSRSAYIRQACLEGM